MGYFIWYMVTSDIITISLATPCILMASKSDPTTLLIHKDVGVEMLWTYSRIFFRSDTKGGSFSRYPVYGSEKQKFLYVKFAVSRIQTLSPGTVLPSLW